MRTAEEVKAKADVCNDEEDDEPSKQIIIQPIY